jgi:hypothetical protein
MRLIILLTLFVTATSFAQMNPMGPFGQGMPTQYQGSPFPGGAVGYPPMGIGERPALGMNQVAAGAGTGGSGCTVDRNGATRLVNEGGSVVPGPAAAHQ